MRLPLALVLLIPSFAFAQPSAEPKKATVKWITDQQAPDGGFYPGPENPRLVPKPVPLIGSTTAAVEALKVLGAEVPNKEKHTAYLLNSFDPKTGVFKGTGGNDTMRTAAGVVAAIELGVPKEKFAKAMDYLKANTKFFVQVAYVARAVEAWGPKDRSINLDDWDALARAHAKTLRGGGKNFLDGESYEFAALACVYLSLPFPPQVVRDVQPDAFVEFALVGQRDDGGWGKMGAKASDIHSTFVVLRAVALARAPDVVPKKLKDVKKLRAFVDAHRNADGGYALKPRDPSNLTATYYCVSISKWLDEFEKK